MLSSPHVGSGPAQIGPAVLGASSFACADVMSKVVLIEGADVLTMSAVRAVIGLAILFGWMQLVPSRAAFGRRETWIALCLGVVFAGNVFLVFKAIETVEVPIAILTYFVYPLLTGLAAAASGLERVTWRGAAAALAAFLGLALMIGAHPTTLAAVGILAALGAAVCRVAILLVTRGLLSRADPLRITWYSLLSSTVRIGPFRTALFMNLEPLLTTIGSALFLAEVLTPLQTLGGAVMLAALVMFQLRR